MSLLTNYPYLATNLCNLAALAALLAVLPGRWRRMALVSGLLAAPGALQATLDVPGYWNPTRTWVLAGVAPEDVVFASFAGGLCWLAATWRSWRQWQGAIRWRDVALVASGSAVLMLTLRLACRAAGLREGVSLLLATGLWAGALLVLQRKFWPLASCAVATFVPVYFLVVKANFAAAPGYLGQWNAAALCGVRLWGVPVEEVAWSAVFAAGWPVAVAWAVGLRPAAEAPAGS